MVCNGLYELIAAGLLEFLPEYLNDGNIDKITAYLKSKMNAKIIETYSLTDNSLRMRIDDMIFAIRRVNQGVEQNFELSFETAIWDVTEDDFKYKSAQIEKLLKEYTRTNRIVPDVIDKRLIKKGFIKKQRKKKQRRLVTIYKLPRSMR